MKVKSLNSVDLFCTPQDDVINQQLNKSTLETDHKSITKFSRKDQSLNGGFNTRPLADATKMFNEGMPRRPRSSQGGISRGRSGNKTRKVKKYKELSKFISRLIAIKDLKKGLMTKYVNQLGFLGKKFRSQSKNASYFCKDDDLFSKKNGFYTLKDFFKPDVVHSNKQ